MEAAGQRSSLSAMQLALEALESDPMSHAGLVSRKQAITALRQALVASQERVDEKAKREHEWVGLTDKEIHQAFCHVGYETPNDWNKDPESWCIANAKYLQAILKEKNHG
jgi:hypothetical protein